MGKEQGGNMDESDGKDRRDEVGGREVEKTER